MGGSCRRQITGESKGQALHDAVHFCRTPNIVLSKAATRFQRSDISSRPISCPGRETLLIAESRQLAPKLPPTMLTSFVGHGWASSPERLAIAATVTLAFAVLGPRPPRRPPTCAPA